MNIDYYAEKMQKISLSMFRKSFFGIFHGSISAKISDNQFLINKKNAIFDNFSKDDMVLLYTKKDYRWNDASIDSDIHLNIYKTIKEAKCVCYAMPPQTVAYTLKHDFVIPKDYFGFTEFGKVEIYDIKKFDDWYERAPSEISHYMFEENTDVMVIKGYGIYAYARNLSELAKKIAIIENSCYILNLENF